MGLCGCAVVHCIPSKRDGPHRFVNPKKNKDLFKIWIKALGNKYLLDLDEHYVYQHYRVCSIHFIEEDFGPNHGLKRTLKSTAFPKLFLPVPMKIPADYSGLDILNSIKIDHDYAGQENAMGISDVINNSHDTTTIGRPFQVDKMFSEPVLDYRDGNCSLKTLSVKRLTELTPMKNDLCQAIKDLKRQKVFLSRRKLKFKDRLKTNFSESHNFEKLTRNLNEISKNYFKRQLYCSSKKPKGFRFTLKDKITVLALYKQSHCGYKLLSNIFALPSRLTIMKLLKNIPIEPG